MTTPQYAGVLCLHDPIFYPSFGWLLWLFVMNSQALLSFVSDVMICPQLDVEIHA